MLNLSICYKSKIKLSRRLLLLITFTSPAVGKLKYRWKSPFRYSADRICDEDDTNVMPGKGFERSKLGTRRSVSPKGEIIQFTECMTGILSFRLINPATWNMWPILLTSLFWSILKVLLMYWKSINVMELLLLSNIFRFWGLDWHKTSTVSSVRRILQICCPMPPFDPVTR